MNKDLKQAWYSPSADNNLCYPSDELRKALNTLKPGKSLGPDGVHPEFFKNLPSQSIMWLSGFYTTCIKLEQIPKLWRKAKVIDILKPGKPADDPASYRPISVLCIGFKLFERVILNRIGECRNLKYMDVYSPGVGGKSS